MNIEIDGKPLEATIIPEGFEGIIISPVAGAGVHIAADQAAEASQRLSARFGHPVVVLALPVDVQTVPPMQYGLRTNNGAWLTSSGAVVTGTKGEMCALRDNLRDEGRTATVQLLPTE